MSDTKIDVAKYLVIYQGAGVLFTKECVKEMRVEAPDTLVILGKLGKDLTEGEKAKLSKDEKLKLEEKLKVK